MPFKESLWKECPDYVSEYRKYSVDEKNPRVTTKINDSGWCTIIGNTHLPHNKVTSWNIKILKSRNSNRNSIYIGIAPSDINQNESNYNKCGWYFNCYHQHCGQDLLTATTIKNIDQERKRKWRIRSHRRQCGCCDGHSKG